MTYIDFYYSQLFVDCQGAVFIFLKEIFVQRLKELRLSKNLTLEQLGKEFDVTKQTVSNWELGLRIPSLETTVFLANYFDVSIDYLTGRIDTPYCEEYLLKIEKELLRHMPYTGIPAKYKDPALRNQHYSIETRLKIIALMKIMGNYLKESIERYKKNTEKLEPGILNDVNALLEYALGKIGLKSTVYDIDHDERNRQIKISQDLYKLLNNVDESEITE